MSKVIRANIPKRKSKKYCTLQNGLFSKLEIMPLL